MTNGIPMIVRPRLVLAIAAMFVWAAVLGGSLGESASARAAAPAPAATSGPPTVLRPAFHRIAGSTVPGIGLDRVTLDRVWVAGHWVFVDAYSGVVGGQDGILINERNGRQTRPSRRGCSPAAIGGLWLAFDCLTKNPRLDSAMLYRLATGKWQTVEIAKRINHACELEANCIQTYVTGVGRYWIRFETQFTTSTPGEDRTLDRFQNLRTGAVRRDPSDSRTRPNLDSPALADRICAPLSYGQGVFLQAGPFALAQRVSGTPVSLEHCGSPERFFVCSDSCDLALVLNQHAAVWAPFKPSFIATSLDGWLLAGKQAVQIALPAPTVDDLFNPFALSAGKLYVITSRGVYVAPSPGGP